MDLLCFRICIGSYTIMSNVLEKIETKLDKAISDLEQMNNNNLLKIIDDLEGIKQIILIEDCTRLSGQLNWLSKKENKNDI
jgi:hypothetical protein